MRRFAAVLLLVTFWSYLSAPLLALSSDRQNLPVCCRNNGKHHCMASMGVDHESDPVPVHISAPFEKCPMFPKAIMPGTAAKHLCTLPSSGTFYAALRSHPACTLQTEARYRVSYHRARQKRGPPAVLPS